ncbi:MAG: DedA family protein [Acidilobus sp.]
MRAAVVAGLLLIVLGIAIGAYRALDLGGSFMGNAVRLGSDVIGKAGLTGVMALMAAESAAIPIPSEVVVPLAGAYFRTPSGLAGVVAFSTNGNVIGSLTLYYVGLLGGRPVAYRYASAVGVSQETLRDAEELFLRRGGLIVIAGRLTPALRSYVSLPAGIFRMARGRFLAATAVGSMPWNAALAYAGYVLGNVAASLPWFDYLVAAISITLGVVLVMRG